jgi:hypothetical protein
MVGARRGRLPTVRRGLNTDRTGVPGLRGDSQGLAAADAKSGPRASTLAGFAEGTTSSCCRCTRTFRSCCRWTRTFRWTTCGRCTSSFAEHLAGGRSVLVDAANTDKNDRRALLDLASRYLASTLAVVCSPGEGETDMIAALPAEGWQAVVVAR